MPRWKSLSASRVPSRSARCECGSASPQRPLRCEGPREHVVAVDRGPLGAGLAGERERVRQADAVVDVEERRLEVGLDPVRDEQPLDHADQRVLLARLLPAGRSTR